MQQILAALGGLLRRVRSWVATLWRLFRGLVLWLQLVIGAVVLVALLALASVVGHGAPSASTASTRSVTLRSVAELSGAASGGSELGTVRSRSEADVLAEAAGTVERVNVTLGSQVGGGAVLAELENDTESAAVLQAEGAYDAAVAARASVSPTDAAATARNAFRSAYSTLDTAVTTYLDTFFGGATPSGPSVKLTTTVTSRDQISRERATIDTELVNWQKALATVDTTDPATLIAQAQSTTADVQALSEELARSANNPGSGATSDQLTALAAARTAINGVSSSLAAALATWRSGSTGTTASVDASVKAALGTLRLAQANYEKTIIRAPIAGTVNFIPIRVGDYVTNLMHVATVAQNGALEVVLYVTEDVREALTTGAKVTISDDIPGVVTQIAPALDPVTKQIEVHVAPAGDTSTLTNGQSVRVALPSLAAASSTQSGPLLLPLSAVKLSAEKRMLFTVNADGRLVAIPVTVGEVRGDRIEVTTDIPADTRIVTDARGLSEGQAVNVAAQE